MKRLIVMAVVAATAVLPGLQCAAAATRKAARPTEAELAASAITRFRKAQGLGPVAVDAKLMAAARAQAEAMAARRQLSHEAAGSFSSRIRATGFRWGESAENIGVGYATLAEMLDGWERSPEHRKNMLLRSVTRIGLARAAASTGELYWALVLASSGEPPRLAPRQASQGYFGSGPAGLTLFGIPLTR